MPIYEYQCKICGHKFEELQKISDQPLTICPKCQKPGLQKLVSALNFHLKGSGWYKTDYKKNPEQSQNAGKDKSAGEVTSTAAAESKTTGEAKVEVAPSLSEKKKVES